MPILEVAHNPLRYRSWGVMLCSVQKFPVNSSPYPMEDFRADVAELFRLIKACEESRERLEELMTSVDNSESVH